MADHGYTRPDLHGGPLHGYHIHKIWLSAWGWTRHFQSGILMPWHSYIHFQETNKKKQQIIIHFFSGHLRSSVSRFFFCDRVSYRKPIGATVLGAVLIVQVACQLHQVVRGIGPGGPGSIDLTESGGASRWTKGGYTPMNSINYRYLIDIPRNTSVLNFSLGLERLNFCPRHSFSPEAFFSARGRFEHITTIMYYPCMMATWYI